MSKKLVYLTSLVLVLSLADKGWATASNPHPADGAIHTDTWVSLEWSSGTDAVSYDIYFGENFDDVKLGTGGTFRGNQTGRFFIVGFPGFLLPNGLVPGTTYYWRIDEVNVIHPDSPWKGDVWSFSIPPSTAHDPEPADGAEIADKDVRLSWTAGFGAVLHTVYFGESFDDVYNATSGHIQGTRNYAPGPLEFDKTYYWRVDEFDSILSYKGDVWSFTVRAFIEPVVPDGGAGRTIYVDRVNGDNRNDGLTAQTALATIQRGIDSAADGDTIIVMPATYTGNGNRDLDFHGKAITVRSIDPNDQDVVATTIIDCQGTEEEPHRGFHFHSSETSTSVIDGLTIKNGYKHPGAGIYCIHSGPIIKNCTITENTAEWSNGIGGGCFFSNSSAEIIGCQITFNSAVGTSRYSGNGWGGGIASDDSNLKIKNSKINNNSGTASSGGIGAGWNSRLYIDNCIISDNSSEAGGGLKFQDSYINIKNSTITGNLAEFSGGGFYCIRSNITVTNSIIWGNTSGEIDGWGSEITVSYCDVQGGYEGEGNINANPLFVDAANADYHLQEGSPCINAGNNSAIPRLVTVDFDGNPRIIDGIVDMGAYEFEHPPLNLRASNPSPAEGAIDVSQTPTLRWNAGERASLHDVYFGTDEQAVRNASIRSPEYKGTKGLGSERYEPGKLDWNTTYYWRIDEYNIDETISEGEVWSFTVMDVVDAMVDPLAEALDTTLSFTTGGNADWFSQTRRWYHNGNAVQSGEITHDQETWLQTTVNGAGTVSFFWKVSSEGKYDCLEFYIDGTLEGQISGSEDWHDMTYEITGSALHRLEWRYFKDGSMSRGEDCGWVDKVEWVP